MAWIFELMSCGLSREIKSNSRMPLRGSERWRSYLTCYVCVCVWVGGRVYIHIYICVYANISMFVYVNVSRLGGARRGRDTVYMGCLYMYN